MRNRVLIIVENGSVPLDDRVWKEALALQSNGYDVTVLCPKDKGYERRYEVISGVRIYRHPMRNAGRGAIAYLWEYACALLWQAALTSWIYLRHGFDVIQGCNPPDDIVLVALPARPPSPCQLSFTRSTISRGHAWRRRLAFLNRRRAGRLHRTCRR